MAATKRILLTSFATWQPHQRFNSSDQLLSEIAQSPQPNPSLLLLRQLPVNLPVAKELTIGKIQQLKPDLVLCCGMAEIRPHLNVETQAVVNGQILTTGLDVQKLTANLPYTVVSQNAGRFVCNSLYHAMLNYLKTCCPDREGLFIHVPRLTVENWEPIVADFRQLLERLLMHF